MSATGPAADAVRAPLRVLRVGAGGGQVPEGVEERRWPSLDVELPAALAGRPLAAIAAGTARIDVSPVTWADVLVLRGPFATIPACLDCGLADADDAVLVEHAREAGHTWRRPIDQMVRGLVMALEREPALLRSRGLVVELPGDPADGVPDAELDLVRALLRAADRVLAPDAGAAAAASRLGAIEGRVVVVDPSAAGDASRRAALLAAAAARDPRRRRRRLELRAADAAASSRLRDRAVAGLPAWDPEAAIDPLVSVVIAAGSEPAAIVGRAVASALACPGVRLEVLVAGGPASAAAAVVAEAGDPRVRLQSVASASVAAALAAGIDGAAGAWIAPLDARSLMAEEHPATLLEVVREHGLDAVYAQTLLVADGEPAGLVGAWPPAADAIAPDASLFSAGLRAFRPDPDAPADGEDPHWNLWRRWSEAGARLASVDAPLALREAGVRPLAAAEVAGLAGALP